MHEFKVHDTVKSDFWIDTKKSVDVDMMEQTIGLLHYAEIDGVQILKIPYKCLTQTAFLIIAPKAYRRYKIFQNNLTRYEFTASRDTIINVFIPFKITSIFRIQYV